MIKFDLSELNKLYYSIGEVAELFNVNTSLIRFWEKEFHFTPTKKNAKGNRLYTVKDIENFNKIYQLVKEEGFTLEGAKKALKEKKSLAKKTDAIDAGNQQLIEKLEQIKEKLLRLKK